MTTAVNFLGTDYSRKLKFNDLKYEQKRKARSENHFTVSPENEAEIWHHLSQVLYSIGNACLHTKILQRKGAFRDDDNLVEFARKIEKKFEVFEKSLPEEKINEYKETKADMEDLFNNLTFLNADQLNRVMKFTEKLLRKG